MSGILKRTAQDVAAVALMTSGGLYGVDWLNAGQYLHLKAARLSTILRCVASRGHCPARLER